MALSLALALCNGIQLALYSWTPAAGGTSPVFGSVVSAGWFLLTGLVGLVVTGNYGWRSSTLHRATLLKGSVLIGTLQFWGPLLADGVRQVVLPFIVLVSITCALLVVGRRMSHRFLTHVWPGARGAVPAILVGTEDEYRSTIESVVASPRSDYRVIGYVSLRGDHRNGSIGALDDLAELIDRHRIETVLVGGYLPDHHLETIVDVSLTAGCELLYPATSLKIAGVRPRVITRDGQIFFELGDPVLKAQQLLIKRVVDLIGAAFWLIVLFPLLVGIALAIKFDSPGPVLFGQYRAGLGGRRFRMLKFRTMRVGAEHEKSSFAHLNHSGDSRLFKIPQDPRVTRLGAWLRRWSLDELPQLWNVLVGDMSLVGPRPFFESDLEDYEAHHFRRLGAKPGISGLWQVSGRSSVVDFEEVVRLDRDYIERWSLRRDAWIMLRTIPAVLQRTGAY